MRNKVLVRIVSADALVLKYQVISTHNSDSAPPLFKNSLGLQGLYSATNCADNILGRFIIILQNQIARVDSFSCPRLRQWPVTYLITLSDWIMSCQPGRHAVVTVCEPDWKHKWAAYKSFDATSSFNNLSLLFLRNRSLQILQRYVMCPPRGIREISMGFSP